MFKGQNSSLLSRPEAVNIGLVKWVENISTVLVQVDYEKLNQLK